MRLQTISALVFLILPAGLFAKAFNEMTVEKLNGTIMVQHPGDAKPFAIQTGSTLEKGDLIMVYDKSWIILKTHRGDKVGLDGNTTLAVDEFYMEGPDRQVRFILQKGVLFLKTNGCDSRQSFFEINVGSEVASVGEVQAVLSYHPEEKEHLQVQYFRGKMTVIDKTDEHKFGIQPKVGSSVKNVREKEVVTDMSNTKIDDYIPEWSELNWENGTLIDKKATPIDELVNINYRRFYNGEPRLKPAESNILLNEDKYVPDRYK